MKSSKVRSMAMAAMMGALAFVLQYFSFQIPFLSPFGSLELSALPEIIGGFVLGPVWAVVIIAIKLALILGTKGTSSMFTGEIQNFILSCAYVLPAIYVYKKNHTKKGAILGLITGSAVSIVVAIFTNVFLIFPAYITLYGMSWEIIFGMFAEVNPFVKNMATFIIFSVIPFNLVSRAISSVITFLVYKRISVPMKRFLKG